MVENSNQPREYDVVLGGQAPPPVGAVVLGGLEGVKRRWTSMVVEQRVLALRDALKYGEPGLDLVIQALENESGSVQWAAYALLRERSEPKAKQALLESKLDAGELLKLYAAGERNFSKANLSSAFLTEAPGKKIILIGAYLSGADLRDANLSGASLWNANLSCAMLHYADLRSANLNDASLKCANLSYADLTGANLSCADLRAAKLKGADLSGAKVSGVKLRGANLEDCIL